MAKRRIEYSMEEVKKMACIEDILKEIEKHGGKLSSKMRYINSTVYPQKMESMNRWNYMYTYFQAIERISRDREPTEIPSMLENVYNMALENTHRKMLSDTELKFCTGALVLCVNLDDDFSDYVFLDADNTLLGVRVDIPKDIGKTSEEFVEYFLKPFAKQLLGCKRNMSTLALSIHMKNKDEFIDGHANMIFIYIGPSFIMFSLYEPHGFESDEIWFSKVDVFMDFLVNSCNEHRELFGDRLVWKNPRIEISCPLGLQRIPETEFSGTDETGYCVMYSYFWLYVILRCVSFMTFSKGNVIDNTNSAEIHTLQAIIKNAEFVILESRTPEELGILINSFAGMAVSRYIEIIPDKVRVEYFDYIKQEFLYNKNKKHILSTLPIDIASKKDRKEYDREYDYRDSPRLPSRKHDNQPCNRDDDCMSVYCNNKKCTARKDDGEACYIHRECMSDYCDPYLEMCGGKPFKNKKKRG